MNTSEFVDAVYLTAVGKLPPFAVGSAKYNKIVAIGNLKIDTWQSEPGVDWYSLYDDLFSLGTVTATREFPLDDSIRKISEATEDYVTIVHTDGAETHYRTVTPDKLKYYSDGNFCAKIGRNLVFNKEFTEADPQFGGEILAPVFLKAAHLSAVSDEVPVDNPQWLVLISAAEWVRTDIVTQNQYPNLVNEANVLMASMKDDNEAQITEVSRPWGAPGATW